MKLYNTLTRKIENFVPRNKNEVTLYTCGPTVYHFAHIGNMRNYISEDILEKSLNYLGYSVKRCMNITDVGHLTSDSDSGDDKMLKGAKREHTTVLDIAKKYTEAFKKDCEKLNIKWPEIVVPATSYINEYIKMTKTLLEKNYAYESNGNIYFDISKLDNYYSLINQNDEMVIGARESVEKDKNKKNQGDFVLWFTKSKFDDQELKWDSPFGTGYPGWHIECSAIAINNLGEYLDIHCGGVDNIFPHHTNEIAQSESYLGHKWCNYWFHTEHLNDKSGKMSKSKGDFLTVDTLIQKGYNPLIFRYMCLSSHYRKQLLFDFHNLDNMKDSYNKLLNKIKNIKNEGVLEEEIKQFQAKFKEALENDLNTSQALTVLYDVLKSNLSGKSKLYLIKDFDQVLGLDLLKKETIDEKTKSYIENKIKERNLAKQNKNYQKADQIREELQKQNIIIKDTREGTTFEIQK